jgi:hypothetical protein
MSAIPSQLNGDDNVVMLCGRRVYRRMKRWAKKLARWGENGRSPWKLKQMRVRVRNGLPAEWPEDETDHVDFEGGEVEYKYVQGIQNV